MAMRRVECSETPRHPAHCSSNARARRGVVVEDDPHTPITICRRQQRRQWTDLSSRTPSDPICTVNEIGILRNSLYRDRELCFRCVGVDFNLVTSSVSNPLYEAFPVAFSINARRRFWRSARKDSNASVRRRFGSIRCEERYWSSVSRAIGGVEASPFSSFARYADGATPADHSIGPVRERRFVDDRIVDSRPDSLSLAPVLRECGECLRSHRRRRCGRTSDPSGSPAPPLSSTARSRLCTPRKFASS